MRILNRLVIILGCRPISHSFSHSAIQHFLLPRARLLVLSYRAMSVYTPILATLAYILSPDRKSVLMINRNSRPDDLHYGKYNGLGGKLSDSEDVISGLCREIEEESGLTPVEIALRGTISWPGFGTNDEAWFAFIFRVDSFTGTPRKSNAEGSLEWMPIEGLAELNLWESDRLWLNMVFDDSPKIFHGIAPFKNGKLVSWKYQRV